MLFRFNVFKIARILIGALHLDVNAATEESPYSNYKEDVVNLIKNYGYSAQRIAVQK